MMTEIRIEIGSKIGNENQLGWMNRSGIGMGIEMNIRMVIGMGYGTWMRIERELGNWIKMDIGMGIRIRVGMDLEWRY